VGTDPRIQGSRCWWMTDNPSSSDAFRYYFLIASFLDTVLRNLHPQWREWQILFASGKKYSPLAYFRSPIQSTQQVTKSSRYSSFGCSVGDNGGKLLKSRAYRDFHKSGVFIHLFQFWQTVEAAATSVAKEVNFHWKLRSNSLFIFTAIFQQL